MKIHDKLPEEGAYKAKYESEFYELKERKRVLTEENRVLRKGLRYLIYSRYSRRFFERTLGDYNETEEDIAYYLERGWIWIFPTEENKEWIREEVEKNKTPYWALMRRRQAEMNFERHNQIKNDGNGYQWRMAKYKREKQRK